MKNTLILIAGMPATGKTRFADYLSESLKVPLISKDKLKEIIWDNIHYDTSIRTESQKYGKLAYDLSFHFCESIMKSGQTLIFESNFMNPCPEKLKSMVEKYGYKVVMVLFEGDDEIVFKRFLSRDLSPERHPGLVSNNALRSPDVFKAETQPCRDFDYGDVRIIANTNDFAKVSYNDLLREITSSI